MTTLLQQAFAEASKLAEAEQDLLGSRLLEELKGRSSKEEAAGWPPGYFESTCGSIDDETFERPPQCCHEAGLVKAADELFCELDAREAADAKP
jgi:hypothetical protein